MAATASRENYSEWLARKMQERGFSLRSLSRTWNPTDPETARRALRRYLKGMVPIERTRQEIAQALGSDETGPEDGADDAEAD